MTPKTMFVLLTLTAATAVAQAPAPPPPAAATVTAPSPDGARVKTKTRDVQYRVERFNGPGGPGGPDVGFHSTMRIAPPGLWWKNPDLVQKLSLSADQQKKMDDIFQQSRIQLIDLKANVEKQEVLLEPMLSANPPDTNKVLAQIDHVASARAELEKANARMLLGIRGVLTADQWTKLQAEERDHRPMIFKGPGGASGFIIHGGPDGPKGPGGPGPESLMRQLPIGPLGLIGPGMGFSTDGAVGLFNQLPQTTFQLQGPVLDFDFALPDDGLDVDL